MEIKQTRLVQFYLKHMKFIIQDLDNDKDLFSKLKEKNIEYIKFPDNLFWLDYRPWIESIFLQNHYKENESYFFVGSIPLMNLLNSYEVKCSPFYNKELYNFNVWSSFSDNCLNKPFVLSTISHCEDSKIYFSKQNEKFFIRPVSGWKPFTGDVTNFADSTWSKIKMEAPPWEIVVIAPVKNIDLEYRLFVDFENENIITGTSYGWDDNNPKRKYDNDIPKKVKDETINIIQSFKNAGFEPAPYIFIDMHYDSKYNNSQLIEIGCAHTCGLYGCDKIKFFKTIYNYYNL